MWRFFVEISDAIYIRGVLNDLGDTSMWPIPPTCIHRCRCVVSRSLPASMRERMHDQVVLSARRARADPTPCLPYTRFGFKPGSINRYVRLRCVAATAFAVQPSVRHAAAEYRFPFRRYFPFYSFLSLFPILPLLLHNSFGLSYCPSIRLTRLPP